MLYLSSHFCDFWENYGFMGLGEPANHQFLIFFLHSPFNELVTIKSLWTFDFDITCCNCWENLKKH